MGKGLIIVVTSSIVLMTLFCVFSYLMSTVNPKPIISNDIFINVGKGKDKGKENGVVTDPDNRDDPENKVVPENKNDPENVVDDAVAMKYISNSFLSKLQKHGALRYGLEKANQNEYIKEATHQTHIFIVPNKYIKPLNITKATTEKNNINRKFYIPMLKKGKRRSVNGNTHSTIEPKTGAVILKILDDNGHTKIEIKVEADAFKENNKKDSKHASTEEKTQIQKREYKNLDTVIKILPNNSLFLDKPEQSSLLLDFSNDNNIISEVTSERKSVINTNQSSTSSVMFEELKNSKIVLFSATNSTVKSTVRPER